MYRILSLLLKKRLTVKTTVRRLFQSNWAGSFKIEPAFLFLGLKML